MLCYRVEACPDSLSNSTHLLATSLNWFTSCDTNRFQDFDLKLFSVSRDPWITVRQVLHETTFLIHREDLDAHIILVPAVSIRCLTHEGAHCRFHSSLRERGVDRERFARTVQY